MVVSDSDFKILNTKLMIGSILNDEGKLPEAVAYFEEVISFAKDEPQTKELIFTAHLLLATAHRMMGNL